MVQGTVSPVLLNISEMIKKEIVESIVRPRLEEENLFLVEISISASNCILITIDGDKGVGIDACVAISRLVESSLNREEEDFELEVASAGIGQPLKIVRQYVKNIGREVEVLKKNGEKLKGVITAATDKDFTVTYTKKVAVEGKKAKQNIEQVETLAYGDVKTTKEVISFK
ncbi:ribosome maturation factor RimP [Tenuifilaceae bacterium CYCD]|nr:ribosome maturation factor RimP [Tenuifilaceae bacterium CYCD]